MLNFVAGAGALRVAPGSVRYAVDRRVAAVRTANRRAVVVGCSEAATASPDAKAKLDLNDLEKVTERDAAKELLKGLSEQGDLTKWGIQKLSVRSVSIPELKMSTRLDADALGLTQKSTEDLRVASFVVVGGSSLLAILCSAIFSGDLAYFSTYLVGGISILFLAIGSTNPGLLAGLISIISATLRPDFKERLITHEAGHFLAGYLCGVPVEKYDINPVTTAVQFYENDYLKEDVKTGRISRTDLDAFSVVALAGPVAEAIKFGAAEGGMADLSLLQTLLVRTKPMLVSREQQDQTRWAAFMANSIIKKYNKEYDALVAAMTEKKSVSDCIRAIESA